MRDEEIPGWNKKIQMKTRVEAHWFMYIYGLLLILAAPKTICVRLLCEYLTVLISFMSLSTIGYGIKVKVNPDETKGRFGSRLSQGFHRSINLACI